RREARGHDIGAAAASNRRGTAGVGEGHESGPVAEQEMLTGQGAVCNRQRVVAVAHGDGHGAAGGLQGYGIVAVAQEEMRVGEGRARYVEGVAAMAEGEARPIHPQPDERRGIIAVAELETVAGEVGPDLERVVAVAEGEE